MRKKNRTPFSEDPWANYPDFSDNDIIDEIQKKALLKELSQGHISLDEYRDLISFKRYNDSRFREEDFDFEYVKRLKQLGQGHISIDEYKKIMEKKREKESQKKVDQIISLITTPVYSILILSVIFYILVANYYINYFNRLSLSFFTLNLPLNSI